MVPHQALSLPGSQQRSLREPGQTSGGEETTCRPCVSSFPIRRCLWEFLGQEGGHFLPDDEGAKLEDTRVVPESWLL